MCRAGVEFMISVPLSLITLAYTMVEPPLYVSNEYDLRGTCELFTALTANTFVSGFLNLFPLPSQWLQQLFSIWNYYRCYLYQWYQPFSWGTHILWYTWMCFFCAEPRQHKGLMTDWFFVPMWRGVCGLRQMRIGQNMIIECWIIYIFHIKNFTPIKSKRASRPPRWALATPSATEMPVCMAKLGVKKRDVVAVEVQCRFRSVCNNKCSNDLSSNEKCFTTLLGEK